MTTRMLLAAVACAVAMPALAQTPKPSPDAAEYRAYRLSAPVMKKVEAVTEMYTAEMKRDPRYKDAKDPTDSASSGDETLDQLEAEMRKTPPIMKALDANGLAPREYLKFVGIITQAYVVASAQDAGAQAKDRSNQLGAAMAIGLFGQNLAPENIAWVKANRAAVDQFMQALQQLGQQQ